MTNAAAGANAAFPSHATGTAIWTALIAGLTVVGSYGYACAAPLAAVAAIAALTLDRTNGLILIGLAWIINQAVGFLLLSYPHTADTYLWGAAIGAGAFAGFLAARAVSRTFAHPLIGWAVAFLTAFVFYQLGMYFGALVFTDPASAFTTEIVNEVFVINAVAYAGFALVYRLAVALWPARPAGASRPVAAAADASSGAA